MISAHIGLDILRTDITEKTGSVLMQLGDVASETVECDNVESWQHVCFVSRPSKPEKGKQACQAVVMDRGGQLAVIATRDLRGQQLIGNLADGEFCVYAPGPDGKAQGRILGKADGSITLYTTNTNEEDGTSVYFRVAKDGFAMVAPWGKLVFDELGIHVSHSSGAKFDLGAIGGLPAPLDVIGSYIAMQAGTVKVKASAQSFGTGAPLPLAGSTGVLAAISALQAQITALQGAIAAITSVTPGATALTTFAALLTSSAASVSSAAVAIPATTSST